MFRFNDKTPITFQDALPDSVDVAIIGAGVIGATSAWYLAEKGLKVLLCDKGRVAGEQSSRNWGWARVTGRDPDEVPVALDSLECWEALQKQLGDGIGFTRQGVMGLAETDEELALFEAWMEIAAQYDMDSRMLSANDVGQVIDVPKGRWRGGLITPSDARAEPFTAVPTIAKALQERGGLIRESCAVRTIDVEGGRVTGIVTEAGSVKTSSVVCAAGAWSSLLLSNQDIELPQLSVRNTVARLEPCPSVFDGAAVLKDVGIRRRQDGGYTIGSPLTEHFIGADSFRYLLKFVPAMGEGSQIKVRLGRDVTQQSFPKKRWGADSTTPFERHRVLNPEPSELAVRQIHQRLRQRIPALADVPIAEVWAGMVDAMPDVVPVIDRVETLPGLVLATGFSGHGFGIGPGAGKTIADLVVGNTPKHDLSRFRFSRFSDGSKMRPRPCHLASYLSRGARSPTRGFFRSPKIHVAKHFGATQAYCRIGFSRSSALMALPVSLFTLPLTWSQLSAISANKTRSMPTVPYSTTSEYVS